MTSPRKLRRVLVTGATGFVGRHLCRSLRADAIEVRALVRDPALATELSKQGVECVAGDLTVAPSLREAVRGIDTVVHLGATVGPAHLPPSVYEAANVNGTGSLVDASRSEGIECFVYVSTVAVLGSRRSQQPADENTPCRPAAVYGRTKWEGEVKVLEAATEGFPAVVVRPDWVLGPGSESTRKLFSMIAARRFLVLGAAKNMQQPLWIEDLVEALRCAAQTPSAAGRVYHLAGRDRVTTEELCRTVADATGSRLPSLRVPLSFASVAAAACEAVLPRLGFRPFLDHRKVDLFRDDHLYDISRAEKELDWAPQVSLQEGCRRTAVALGLRPQAEA